MQFCIYVILDNQPCEDKSSCVAHHLNWKVRNGLKRVEYALAFMLHSVQEDIARLKAAVGHYYWVLTNCYTADSILRSFAEYYMFLLCIVRSMLSFAHNTSSWYTLACAAVPSTSHITIYTVLIYALVFGVMLFGQSCTGLLLGVQNMHSVVRLGDGVLIVNSLSHHMCIVPFTVIMWCICRLVKGMTVG
jgi:hypothetical protein